MALAYAVALLVFDTLSEGVLAFTPFLHFVHCARLAFVAVVASVAGLCVFSTRMSLRAQWQPVWQLNIGVAALGCEHRWMCAVQILVVHRAV